MMSTLILKTLEAAINRYIKLDSFYQDKLKKLTGKYLALHLDNIDIDLIIAFYPDTVRLESHLIGEPDLSIRATPINLLRLLTEDNSAHLLNTGKVELDGNILLAQSVSDFFKGIKIDWAHYLQPFLGDALNGQVEKLKKECCEQLKARQEQLQDDIYDYLQHENKTLVNRDEYEAWKQELNHCRDAVERLEARLKLHETKQQKDAAC